MSSKVIIPKHRREPLRVFFSSPEETQLALLHFFERSNAHSERQHFDDLASFERFDDIFDALVEIVLVSSSSTRKRDAFFGAVAEAISQLEEVNQTPKEIYTFLQRVASSSILEVGVRSARAKTAYPNELLEVSIFSDVRPVFSESTENLQMLGLLLKHQLCLKCRNGENEEELFVSLDDDDLEELREVVERAVRKKEAIRSELSSKSPWLGSNE